MYKFFAFAALFMFSSQAFAQENQDQATQYNYAADFEKNYQQRIKLSEINGVYIPINQVEAFSQLDELMEADGLAKFRAEEERMAVRKFYYGFGRWIVFNWGFHEGSRFSHYLKEKFKLTHPDDMAAWVMMTYHRKLNNKPLLSKELADELVNKRLVKIQQSKRKQAGN